MSLQRAARIGAYKISDLLGAGAMGEVYLARDTSLDRQVAIKVLPDGFAQDPERLARFEREARLLASLNHPHIATVYGLEQSDKRIALVMELVEGPTLAEVIESKALPLAEAIGLARQIAEALDAAHEHGIVHRDLKPANIKVKEDGTIKVLDFGLAKAVSPLDSMSGIAGSPTITSPVSTRVGVVLGTPAYMSPEQARGKAIDKRADIWAFGCVLFEMLAGRPPFDGDSVTDVLAGIVQSEPAWPALPPAVPPHLVKLLHRCLEKDRRQRLRDIGDAAAELNVEKREAPLPAPVPPVRGRARERLAWLAAVVAAGAAAWTLRATPAPEAKAVARFTITPPEGQQLTPPAARRVVVSPDGSAIVYAANNQLFQRALDDLEPRAIPGTNEAPILPVFSPDGSFIAYMAPDKASGAYVLKKIAAAGGTPVTLQRGDQAGGVPNVLTREFGLAWLGSELWWAVTPGIRSIPDGGGETRTAVAIDPATEAASWPQLLGDGRRVLFTLRRLDKDGPDASSVVVQALDGSDRRVLVQAGAYGRVVPSGHLVYSSRANLLAAPFDEQTAALTGNAVLVADDISRGWDVSRTGTLVYERAPEAAGPTTLVWVDRQGREQPIATPSLPGAGNVRLSPDRTRIAMTAGGDVWVWSFARDTATRLTLTANAVEYNPAWMPNGRDLVFDSGPAGPTAPRQIFLAPADGSGARRMISGEPAGWPDAVSPDGKHLIFHTAGMLPTSMLQSIDSPGPARPLLNVRSMNAEFSPDGRWIAYQAYDSGKWEVYVQPFPALETGRWQISSSGGTRPLWSSIGRELFYIAESGMLMSVPVEPGPAFSTGKASALFAAGGYDVGGARNYDVSLDGSKFLFTKRRSSSPTIIAVTNWFDEVRRKVAEGAVAKSQ